MKRNRGPAVLVAHGTTLEYRLLKTQSVNSQSPTPNFQQTSLAVGSWELTQVHSSRNAGHPLRTAFAVPAGRRAGPGSR
jgi:hypothetical protein